MNKILLILVAAVVIAGLCFVSIKNKLVRMDQTVKSSWSQVENVYQRRLDLIPNLVNTVKGYAAHEKDTLQAVVEARAKATQTNVSAGSAMNDPQSFQKFQQTQGELSSALSRLMVVVEKYPDLKANQNFLELQSQLEGTENRIAVERRNFTKAVQEYNETVGSFPDSIVASMSGFQPKPYFQADAGANKAPKVKF
ncbi:MAG: LemA family protein [Deltaproteobacteria bacterium]|nr:LemA family protein [Deltaproteobacteria bacterium]